MAGVSPSAKTFTPKQGQYLAYIHLYTRLHRRPPAETDIQEYFRVTPPSVHQMIVTLERAGFIRKQPRTARSIELLVDPKLLPHTVQPITGRRANSSRYVPPKSRSIRPWTSSGLRLCVVAGAMMVLCTSRAWRFGWPRVARKHGSLFARV